MDGEESIAPPSYRSYPPSYQTTPDYKSNPQIESQEWVAQLSKFVPSVLMVKAKELAAGLEAEPWDGPFNDRCIRCGHLTACQLDSVPVCCACADMRTDKQKAMKYVDGDGFVAYYNRRAAEKEKGNAVVPVNIQWGYCPHCKAYWDQKQREPAKDRQKRDIETRIPAEVQMFIAEALWFIEEQNPPSLTVVSVYEEFGRLRGLIQGQPSLCEEVFPFIFEHNDNLAHLILLDPSRFRELLTKSWNLNLTDNDIRNIHELYQEGFKLKSAFNCYLSTDRNMKAARDALDRRSDVRKGSVNPLWIGHAQPQRTDAHWRHGSAHRSKPSGLMRAWQGLQNWRPSKR